jgi:hypothetical protein
MSVELHRTGSARLTLRNPSFGDAFKANVLGSKERTAGGKRFYYAKGITVYTLKLTWDEMWDEEKVALLTFFTDTAEGERYKFNFKDEYGRWYRAHFNATELEFEISDDQRGSKDTFEVGGETYSTSNRTKPIWSTEFELEVVPTTTSTSSGTTAA